MAQDNTARELAPLETDPKSSAKASVLVPQAHGGAIRVGNPGNSGGKPGRSGRPTSLIRRKCALAFANRVKALAEIADGKTVQRQRLDGVETQTEISAEVSDRLKAIDLLGKYGLGTVKEVSSEQVKERVQATLLVLRQHVSAETFAAICAELRPIWA